VRGYIESYDASLPEETLRSPQYEFKVLLIPAVSSKAQADLAIEFVHADRLSEEERSRLEEALVLIKHRQVGIANLGRLKPSDVVGRVASVFSWFNMAHHTTAWKHFGIRPPTGAPNPAETDQKYCLWDSPHRDYVYTDAWVRKLIATFAEGPTTFQTVIGRPPDADFYAPPAA
jgi:hypothetical protein